MVSPMKSLGVTPKSDGFRRRELEPAITRIQYITRATGAIAATGVAMDETILTSSQPQREQLGKREP